MSMIVIPLLVILALLPAVVLCVYIYKKDRVEKEPIGLLFGLLGLGVAIIPPVLIFEILLDELFTLSFAYTAYQTVGTVSFYVYNFINNFFGVALVEEIFKWIVVYLFVKFSKNFNSLFDGIIYSVFVSLGFAAVENVMYVVQNGFTTGIMRAVLSVPGHMFYAVIMGYYFSLWHMYNKAKLEEKLLSTEGIINVASPLKSGNFIFLSILIPVAAHGFYDFCLSIENGYALLLVLGFVIFLYIYCFRKISKISRVDVCDITYAKAIVLTKYPEARDYYLKQTEENLTASYDNQEQPEALNKSDI